MYWALCMWVGWTDLGNSSTRTGHVWVYRRTELAAGLRLDLDGNFANIGIQLLAVHGLEVGSFLNGIAYGTFGLVSTLFSVLCM